LEINCPRIVTALDLLPLTATPRLSTTAASLDALLDGGCAAGHIVELYGASGCAASLIAHSLAVRAAVARGAAIWMDSANAAFSPRRALALVRRALTARQVGGDEVQDAVAASTLLSRMLVSVVVDAFALLHALRHVADAASADLAPVPLRLLVVDSLGALMTPLVSMTDAHALGQATLTLIARQLKAIAVEHNAVVLVVNHALHDGQPALGRAWRYVANERILLDRLPGSTRVRATLTRANSRLVGHHVDFQIADDQLLPATELAPWKC
jgi:RecA/RadA recombinase